MNSDKYYLDLDWNFWISWRFTIPNLMKENPVSFHVIYEPYIILSVQQTLTEPLFKT